MDSQASQLNAILEKDCPLLSRLLSRRGRDIYFPKQGILSQSAQARGKAIDATIGIALEDDGAPMHLPCIGRRIALPPSQAVAYAPSAGLPALRSAWKTMLTVKNPLLAGKPFGTPVVTSALTHALNLCGYLFCDPGDRVVLPDLFWENYELIFARAYDAVLDPFPTFTQRGGFHVEALRDRLAVAWPGRTFVLLNFPNNPSGYTPTVAEARALADVLRQAAQRAPLVVGLDDAYFGLVYEDGVFRESLFGLLCDLHPGLLAVKLDAPTKEDYVWGFRVGFLTFGLRGATPAVYEALEAKAAGAVRGSISNASNLGQSLLLAAYADPACAGEKRARGETLKARYQRVHRILADHPEYAQQFVALPFNSGYFMCVRLTGADPEAVRQALLTEYDTGVIAMGGVIRLAYSAVPADRLPALFENLYRAARALNRSGAP